VFGREGQTALVGGGGQGMGESSARFLAYAGCDVAVLDIVSERAERVAGMVREAGRKGVPVVADVLDDAQLPGTIEHVERELGGLDVLVCIVGQAAFVPTMEMSVEDWDLDHRRNLRYFFLVSQLVARGMIARGQPGAMVCITSIDGLTSAVSHASYGAAKAGLVNLVRTEASEWAKHGIRVNAIAPGSIATPRFPDNAESRERTSRGLIPFKRRGTTDEIGKAALFLASDMASYVTGVTLSVDGGWAAASISGGIDINSIPG
jgi:2-deoxy-D-gluconate 3-dehydrogenase